MASHLRGAEEQQLRSVIETLRKECGSGPRGSHKFRAIVKTVAGQLRQLSDSKVRTSSDIGSIKEPMPAELRGLHARFPPVHFCLSICGIKVVSGHIERDPLVFTIARGRAVADLIEAFATADELASESSPWRSKARHSPGGAAGPSGSGGSRSPPGGPRPEPVRVSAASGPLEVCERDVEVWFDLLVADEARLEAVGTPPPADGEGGVAAVLAWREKAAAAQNTLAFPAAMAQRFVALRLYTAEGQPRDSVQRKDLPVVSSLALMTAALRAHAAATSGEPADSSFGADGPGRVAVGLIGRLTSESAGPTLFGDRLAALPLSLVQLERWGADMRSHAPTAAALGALFLAVVLHGLADFDHVIKPLRSMSAGTKSPTVSNAGVIGTNEPVPPLVLLGHWLESAAGSKAADLGRLSAHYRTLLVDGFKTGFSLLQAVQGEAAASAALPMVKFLQRHGSRASALFLDHYVVVLSSAHPEHGSSSDGGTSTGILRSSCRGMDGYSYPLYARFIDRLLRLADTDTDAGGSGGGSPPQEIVVAQLYRDYQSYRLGLCVNEPKQHPGLGKLVAQLAPIPGVSKFLQTEAVATAVGRTLQMTHAVTRSSGGPMIAAWSQAVACFGAETMRTLVVELNKTGLPPQVLQKPQASPLRSSVAGKKAEPAAQSPSSAHESKGVPLSSPTSSSSASSCAIILEFGPAALHSAAQGRQWGSELPAILAAMGWLFAETRTWLQTQSSNESAQDAQTPQDRHWPMAYSVNLHSFAMRDQPASASPPSLSSPSSGAAFSWGGARGWMAELTAIAAQKRRGDHVELSEERQRRSDAVISSLKQRLTPTEKGLGGLLQLKPAQGVLLGMPPEGLVVEDTGGSLVSGEQQERVAGQPRQRSPSEIGSDAQGSPGRAGAGKKPRRSEGATASSGVDAATPSAERQHRSDLDRRVKELEGELAETKAMLRRREQECDNYRSYNMKLLTHNINLRTAVRDAQQTVPDFADVKADIESKSSDEVPNTTVGSNLISNGDSDASSGGTKEKQADGIMRAHAAAELADTRDRASRIFMLYQESGLEVRDFLELTLSSIQTGGGGGVGR